MVSSEYQVRMDDFNAESWAAILAVFDDSNLYQTFEFNTVRASAEDLSSIVLLRAGEPVAACLLRIFKMPFLRTGVAYARWGPLWRSRASGDDLEALLEMIRVMRLEYSVNRGLVLRILPLLFEEKDEQANDLFPQEGYLFDADSFRQRTLLLDLTQSLEDLRKGFKQKWRNCLNRAEKNNLSLDEGTSLEHFKTFIKIYREMLSRKKFAETSDIDEFLEIQKKLSEALKLRVVICYDDDRPSAGAVYSGMGHYGVYLLGATNDLGMKNNGAYLIQWRIIKALKEMGCIRYNLHGINPDTNPGTYRFKVGLAGKSGEDVHFTGQFDACHSTTQYRIFKAADYMKSTYRNLKIKASS